MTMQTVLQRADPAFVWEDVVDPSEEELGQLVRRYGPYVRVAARRIRSLNIIERELDDLLEDLHDLAVVAERRAEEPMSSDEMKRRLKRRGLL